MKRTVLIVIALGLALAACQPSPAPATHPAATAAAPRDTASETPEKGPKNIPMGSGYGFDGGWYQLYFTDPTNPASDQKSGGPDEQLVSAIDNAKLSIDAAMYSLSLRSIRQALVRAHRRGVTVRVVMESDNMDGSVPQALKEAGIEVLGDRREGLMHNKFLIIDRSEVWTGSMNLTSNSVYTDRNNFICIRSPKLAADYEAEFQEMFVDDKFGPDLGSVTPYPKLVIEGTPINVYFSPDDHPQANLAGLLEGAQSSIYFLAYSFTADPLGDAVVQRAQAGVKVAGVMDESQIKSNAGTEYDQFQSEGLAVRPDGQPGLMHHKVFIIDGNIVVTGSYNFTASAEKSNDENLLVIYNPQIAAEYLQEFERVYGAAKP